MGWSMAQPHHTIIIFSTSTALSGIFAYRTTIGTNPCAWKYQKPRPMLSHYIPTIWTPSTHERRHYHPHFINAIASPMFPTLQFPSIINHLQWRNMLIHYSLLLEMPELFSALFPLLHGSAWPPLGVPFSKPTTVGYKEAQIHDPPYPTSLLHRFGWLFLAILRKIYLSPCGKGFALIWGSNFSRLLGVLNDTLQRSKEGNMQRRFLSFSLRK